MDVSSMTPVEMDILVDLVVHGDNTAKNIAENTERSRSAVQNRFQDLIEKGLVESKGSGVYTLTVEGANTARAILRARESDD